MNALRLVLPPQSTIAVALAAAAEEGVEPNVRRWLAFHGHRELEPIELQAINAAKGSGYTESRFAHALDAETVVELLTAAERWDVPAIYFIANEVDPAVATRATPGKWHPMQKGESTSDAEIASRRVLYIDVDAKRAKGTSATDAEVAKTHAVAEAIFARLKEILGTEGPLGMGASGNGRAVLVALDSIAPTPEVHHTIKGILAALGEVHGTPEVIIDSSVCDAKRLLPAWGSMKRKGSPGVVARPHRRTGIVCQPSVGRLALGGLEHMLARLCEGLTPEQQAVVDKAMGKRPAPTPTRSPGVPRERLFDRANDQPIADVVGRLGLLDGEHVRCPGCGTVGDSSVALIGNGLKCLHARCAQKAKSGFYTVVDCVAESMRLAPNEAVNQIAEWFGFDGFPSREAPHRVPQSAEPPEGWADPEEQPEASRVESTPTLEAPAKRYHVRSIGEILEGVYERAKSNVTQGMPSGVATIDAITGGFRPGRVTVLGASTSWGKSSFALLSADSSIKAGGRVLLVSGEDTEDTYGKRLMAMRAKVNALALRMGASKLSVEDWQKMTVVLGGAEHEPFFLDGIGNSAEFLAKAIAEISKSEQIDLVIIDYLQAFTCAKKCQDRRNEITHIARCFTDAIKGSGAAGLVFSQLKRLDDGVTPTMHDLKESGDVENMAEHVLIGFGVKNVEQEGDAQYWDTWKRYVLIAKNKDGPRPAEPIALDFSLNTASFMPQADVHLERAGNGPIPMKRPRKSNGHDRNWQDRD